MAYSSRFNPDALPAHVEPNEAAQMIANAQAAKNDKTSSPNLHPTRHSPPLSIPISKPNVTKTSSYENKPPPPLPGSPTQQQQFAHRPHGSSNTTAAFRPHSTSQSHQGNTSPPMNSSAWGAPLTTNPSHSHNNMPGTYPTSANSHSTASHSLSSHPTAAATASQRPHSPLPPAGTHDPSLWPLFQAVDVKRSGHLSQAELSSALKNDEYTSFDPETVRMMIKMFDSVGQGTISYEEFCGLWGFLAAWRTLFQRFDEDHSGYISYIEYSRALTAFGYNLSADFVTMMYKIYDRRRDECMTFDLFVQSCIQLKRMTDVFKKYDGDRDGFITLSFEDFLTEVLNVR